MNGKRALLERVPTRKDSLIIAPIMVSGFMYFLDQMKWMNVLLSPSAKQVERSYGETGGHFGIYLVFH